jgi:hypothetical protein
MIDSDSHFEGIVKRFPAPIYCRRTTYVIMHTVLLLGSMILGVPESLKSHAPKEL